MSDLLSAAKEGEERSLTIQALLSQSRACVNDPNLLQMQSHIAQMPPHHRERDGGRLLIWAEKQILELRASNEMAAQNMALDREYMARLESQLDALKNEHRPDPQIGPAIKTLEDYILMRCQRDRFQSYSDLEAERNRLLGALLRIEKLAQAVMPEGKP